MPAVVQAALAKASGRRLWRDAAVWGAQVGFLAGLFISVADSVSALLPVAYFGRAAIALGVSSLVVPLAALVGALTGTWIWFANYCGSRFARPRSTRGVWVTSGLSALPLIVGACWVPLSWLTANWNTLRGVHKGLVVAMYVGLIGGGVLTGRVASWIRTRYELKQVGLPWVHWPLVAASIVVGGVCYWADRTKYVDLYEDFHYGLAGGFVSSVACCVALLWITVRRSRGSGVAVAGLRRSFVFGLALIGVVVLQATQGISIREPRSLVFSKAVGSIQRATDFDSDGHSTLFGSSDCAPFDRSRSPAEIDLPGNGIDEDCNGADTPRWPSAKPVKPYAIPTARGFNLLLITVDALRADRLGVYGSARNTSPHIDRLSREGAVFVNAYSQGSKTFESVPSLFTGLYPANLARDYNSPLARRQKSHVYTLTEEAVLLTQLLKARGYRTQAVVTIGLLRSLGLDRGFDSYARASAEFRRGNEVTQKANEILASAVEPFFLWLHYDEPHDPYDRYDEFRFGERDIDLYDGEIAAADVQIGLVLEQVSKSGLEDRTLVVLTADHGEEFRDHGGQYHAEKLYRELLHVPLIIKVPGVVPGREEQIVELVDVAPTLCEALQLLEDCTVFDGQSLWATRGGQRDTGFGFSGAYAEAIMRRGVLQRRSLLADGFRFNVSLDTQSNELYDVQRDPMEQRNVALSHPAAVRGMQDQIGLRPYRRLAPLFQRANQGEAAGLVGALPRIRSEPMLRFAIDTIARRPTPGTRAALERLLTRPGLGREMKEVVSKHLSQLAGGY